jgi:YegS/Rv2252/BmrU family lipid kinase
MQKIKIAFIINGTRKLTPEVIAVLATCENDIDFQIHQFVTTIPKEGIDFAYNCAEEKFDFIVAVGGDGTVNEVVNGMMMSDSSASILAVIPNGTGNDFYRSTKMIFDQSKFIAAIKNRNIAPIDIAKVETPNRKVYFVNIADVGFGGKVVEILEKQRRFIGGKGSYAIAILRAFISYKRPILSIRTDDFNYQGSVLMVAICNGTIFGDGLTINPFAKIDDGKLNITLLGKVKLLDYIRNLKNLKSGKVINHPEAKYLETEKIEIKVSKGKVSSELDGEFLDEGNQMISVVKGGIKILILE